MPGLFDCTYITRDKLLLTFPLPITNYKFPLKFLEQSSGVLSNCIVVNGKQPCSPSWRFRTMPMTSCNGSIFHLPRLLDFLHCCSLQMRAQRWLYRACRILISSHSPCVAQVSKRLQRKLLVLYCKVLSLYSLRLVSNPR